MAEAERKRWRGVPGSALAPSSCCRQRLQPLASKKPGSVPCSPMHSPWVLFGFASSLELVHTAENKAKGLANHPRCKGLFHHSEACAVGCLGSQPATTPVKASAGAGAGEAGKPRASWIAVARRPGARPRPPGLHWIRPEKVKFPETCMRPLLGG